MPFFAEQGLSFKERYRQIFTILLKHEFAYLLLDLGLEWLVPVHKGTIGHGLKDKSYPSPEHLRLALEELGTTFIKLGQIMSTRADLLPPEYLMELSKLQASVPAVPFAVIKQEIERELGLELDALFCQFDQQPLAAASIGQVHRAVLLSGERVVVKVQRPGVSEIVSTDLEILHHLVGVIAKRTQIGQIADLNQLLDEFSFALKNELNYIQEGHNADQFRASFSDQPTVHIPTIYWNFTTRKVIILEELHGWKVTDTENLCTAGFNLHQIAVDCTMTFLKMVFDDGFFHADPHPGNILIEDTGRIGLIDFGMVCQLDQNTKQQLIHLFVGVAAQDADSIVETMLSMGVAHGEVDREKIKQDVGHFLSRYYGTSLKDINITLVINELLNVAYKHHLRLPANLSLLGKTILMCEGIGRQLDPDFNMVEILVPYAERLMLKQYTPTAVLGRLMKSAHRMGSLFSHLPEQLNQLLTRALDNSLSVGLEIRSTEKIIRELNFMVNRMSLSILAAAFILSLSLLLTVIHPTEWQAITGWVFSLGFIVASILGISLFISIWRSGHR